MSNMNASGTSSSKRPNPLTIELETVRAEYDRADRFCTEVQRFCQKAGIPAINELRNAGKHLFDAMGGADVSQTQEDLRSAYSHARRAAYEAFEAGILTALEIIQKFKTDYSTISLSSIVPDYPQILYSAHEAQKAVDEGREKSFERNSDHTDRMEAFRKLREICVRLEVLREEANKLVEDRAAGAQRAAQGELFARLGILIAGAGLAATLLFGIPNFYDWWNMTPPAQAVTPPKLPR